MENQYIKQFPELLKDKTLLYVHGFGSSGQSGTVSRLRTVLPSARVIAPDLPLHPEEAMALLHDVCLKEKPQLVLGTSMGGMYAEQLRGFDRICVNPAMCIADTMQAHGMTGTQEYQNPRLDGVQQFYVDKTLVKEYRTVSERRFTGIDEAERRRVVGLFGDEDTTVDTYDLFRSHYPQSMHFHGEHRMNDRSFMHSVMPVIRWMDDRQEGRERPIIYIGIETLLHRPTDAPCPTPSELQQCQPASSCQKAVRMLIESYQVFFVAPACSSEPSVYAAVTAWLEQFVNVPAWGHTLFTNQRHLLYGDYLIESAETKAPVATRIAFGSDTFKTWESLISYFELLGGQ